jgi:hypothetical protein
MYKKGWNVYQYKIEAKSSSFARDWKVSTTNSQKTNLNYPQPLKQNDYKNNRLEIDKEVRKWAQVQN